MVKAVTFFLIGIIILAMFGKLRVPRLPRRKRPENKITDARKCPDCGAYILGDGACSCRK